MRFFVIKKQITGVEPASSAWEANVLPMNHICMWIVYFIRKAEIYAVSYTYYSTRKIKFKRMRWSFCILIAGIQQKTKKAVANSVIYGTITREEVIDLRLPRTPMALVRI